ncbi:MAG: MarR family transcriptional regulator [Nitrospinae bacterium]|nr:MarR family transcriptional regulator [Nitrospinota bacterium]
MVDFKENLGRYIAVSGRQLARMVAKKLERFDIGAGQYPYLFALFIEDGQSQQSLSRKLAVDKAAAARSVEKLARSGYVRRESYKDDARSFRVFLNPKAKRARKRLEKAVEEVLAELEKGLTAEERAQVKKLMRKIVENLPPIE